MTAYTIDGVLIEKIIETKKVNISRMLLKENAYCLYPNEAPCSLMRDCAIEIANKQTQTHTFVNTLIMR